MKLFRQAGKYIIPVFLPIIIALSLNSVFFKHAHKLSDGSVIFHAHPFKPIDNKTTPFENHKHSGSELFLLDQITYFLYLTVGIFALALFLNSKKEEYDLQFIPVPVKTYFLNKSPRGPPIK